MEGGRAPRPAPLLLSQVGRYGARRRCTLAPVPHLGACSHHAVLQRIGSMTQDVNVSALMAYVERIDDERGKTSTAKRLPMGRTW